jgi:hypothetical protein
MFSPLIYDLFRPLLRVAGWGGLGWFGSAMFATFIIAPLTA